MAVEEYRVGDWVEVKMGDGWQKGVVRIVRDQQYLVETSSNEDLVVPLSSLRAPTPAKLSPHPSDFLLTEL